MQNNVFTRLLKLYQKPSWMDSEEKTKAFIENLRTRFEPINEVTAAKTQLTVGFECLLADVGGNNFGKILERFKGCFTQPQNDEVTKILDLAAVLTHLDSVTQLCNNYQENMGDVFFSINVSKEVVCNTNLFESLLNHVVHRNIYFELSEKLGFVDKQSVNNAFLTGNKVKYFLDDLYYNTSPDHIFGHFNKNEIEGIKYDHEIFWEHRLPVAQGKTDVFEKHLKEMFDCKKMVIIEGVRNKSDLGFILKASTNVAKNFRIFIQGEFATLARNVAIPLEPTKPFGYLLKRNDENDPVDTNPPRHGNTSTEKTTTCEDQKVNNTNNKATLKIIGVPINNQIIAVAGVGNNVQTKNKIIIEEKNDWTSWKSACEGAKEIVQRLKKDDWRS